MSDNDILNKQKDCWDTILSISDDIKELSYAFSFKLNAYARILHSTQDKLRELDLMLLEGKLKNIHKTSGAILTACLHKGE